MKFVNLITFLASVKLLSLTEGADVGGLVCPFECFNDATCGTCDGNTKKEGQEVCRDGKKCICPEGFTGLRCGRKFESCYESDHPCQNGGKCIEGMDKYDNSKHFCDCSSATDDDGNLFIGKYCQLQAVVKCENDHFCVEGATCNEDGSCDCRNDFEGPHCEFRKGSVPDCDMDCQNGGSCVLGINKYEDALEGYGDFWKAQEDVMYCKCPEGFSGANCEIESNKCGDFHCFNGGTCVELSNANITSHRCDCMTAKTEDSFFAGTFCQYESTSTCENSNDAEGANFCVNNGICKKDEVGCDCLDGFTGSLCEYNKTLVEEEVTESCNLICENGGLCRKDATAHKSAGTAHIVDLPAHDGERCICTKDYFGLTCDQEVADTLAAVKIFVESSEESSEKSSSFKGIIITTFLLLSLVTIIAFYVRRRFFGKEDIDDTLQQLEKELGSPSSSAGGTVNSFDRDDNIQFVYDDDTNEGGDFKNVELI